MAFLSTQTLLVTRHDEVPAHSLGEGASERLGRSPQRLMETQSGCQSATAPGMPSATVGILLHGDDDLEGDFLMRDLIDMDLIKMPSQHPLSTAVSPPIPISTPSVSRSRSRARDQEADGLSAVTEASSSKAKRKKKRNQKKALGLASTFVRGPSITPAASGDEDSDFSAVTFMKRDISNSGTNTANSPYLRPSSACGGISALRQQLDVLNLEPVPGTPSLLRNKSPNRRSRLGHETPSTNAESSELGSDNEIAEMTSYEVPLEHDFISSDVQDSPGEDLPSGTVDNVHRKMHAVDFEPLTCLGKGSFGTVHLVRQRATGRLYAQKQFRKASLTVHKRLIEQTRTERAILESINCHPFVVKLYYAFQDQEKLYLILEYAQGGELFTYLATERMFPEDTASFYMAEMVLALEHLHQTVGVLYRDLKPENCLLDAEGHLLLTDFGLSKVAVEGADRCTSILGTIEYMAPEVILGHMYGTAVDWWSLGALGFDLLTGSPPFRGNNHAKVQEKIVRSKLVLPYFLSPDAKDLLTRFLRKEPNKRLGGNMPKDMVAIKKHRFFRKIDWTALERRELEPPIRPLITDPELAENFAPEFTELALSPVVMHHEGVPWMAGEEYNPFGGFSFVASKSMLDGDFFMI